MAKFENPFRNVKVTYRRSRPLTKVVVIAAIVLSMAALLTLRWTIHDIQSEIAAMHTEAARLEQENALLEEKIGKLGSVEGIVELAGEELGLVDPDTIVIETD